MANIVSAVAVVVGLGFAVTEVREHRKRKARESALVLVRSYQTAAFAEAIVLLIDLPDNASRRELEERLGRDMRLVYLLMTTWESLGILLFRGEVTMDLVDDFFSGVIVLSWRKLNRLVAEIRADARRDTYFEWFEWLADRLAERESDAPPVPAHVQHRDWRPRAGVG